MMFKYRPGVVIPSDLPGRSVPSAIPCLSVASNYTLRETILQPPSNPGYRTAQAKIQQGLDISVDMDPADRAIRHIQKFTGRRNKTQDSKFKDDTTRKKSTPV